MPDTRSNDERGRSAGRSAVARLLSAIEYPESLPGGNGPFTLRVDGAEVHAEEFDGRIVLSRFLSDDESLLPTLARYAAGRMLREDAVLAYGRISDSQPLAFLWQDAPADAGSHEMLRLFETFMDSCDWWRNRVDALRGGETSAHALDENMVIRP